MFKSFVEFIRINAAVFDPNVDNHIMQTVQLAVLNVCAFDSEECTLSASLNVCTQYTQIY